MYPHYKSRTLLNGHWIDGVGTKTQQAVTAELGRGMLQRVGASLRMLWAPLYDFEGVTGWFPHLKNAGDGNGAPENCRDGNLKVVMCAENRGSCEN